MAERSLPSSFRLLDTGTNDATWNMALDEAILTTVGEGLFPPTLRFYNWTRPTVSLGYFQRARAEIDAEEISRRDYHLVRRMTGGRAVLHDMELTYSMTVPDSHPLAKASVVESYRILSMGLKAGFERLGVKAELAALDDERERAKFSSPGSAACFDSPSWYELVVEGKKIAGSAQVRTKGGLLQHGSLLLDLRPEDLFSVLRFRSEALKERLFRDFSQRATSAREWIGRQVEYEDAVRAFVHGFTSVLQVDFDPASPSEQEIFEATRLEKEKYAHDDWTFRR